ncbi:MAG: hypothetical protein LBT22_04395, partial [Peptococcaceae bacterium]|nr:hypothetical protein [Peptococcaceae bacterium]
MKENTLQRIGQTKWARKLLIILMTAILMLSASAAVTLAAPPTGPGLSGVADTPLFGTITIDGIEWIKIREQAQPTATELGELYAMLMPVKVLPGNAIYYAASHSISSPVTYYKSSTLRSTINNWYAGANIPTIKAFAMRNYFNYVGHTEYLDNAGKASDTNTGIYYELAGNVTADTAFALTYTEANSIGYANFNWLEGGPRDTKSYFLRTVYTGTIWGARGWVTSPRGWGYININDNAYVRPAIWVYQGPKTPEPQILSL